MTSVGEGDAGAYAEAIAAITRACGVASVDDALRDESTPGTVLDVMVDRFERYSGFSSRLLRTRTSRPAWKSTA